jgi:hypothetical protein
MMQVEAHHFCKQVNEDFMQCAIYDGNTKDSNLVGIEYIVSERQFEGLPEEEKKYWHPHNGEILSGQLVAPGLPAVAERELMRQKVNSYGKTWHLWHTRHGTQPGDPLPFGEPLLAGRSAARARPTRRWWRSATGACASAPRRSAASARSWCRWRGRRRTWTR